jgi:hypothetical protein
MTRSRWSPYSRAAVSYLGICCPARRADQGQTDFSETRAVVTALPGAVSLAPVGALVAAGVEDGGDGAEELSGVSAISPDSSMAGRVPVMPCLVASQSASWSIQRHIASAGASC